MDNQFNSTLAIEKAPASHPPEDKLAIRHLINIQTTRHALNEFLLRMTDKRGCSLRTDGCWLHKRATAVNESTPSGCLDVALCCVPSPP